VVRTTAVVGLALSLATPAIGQSCEGLPSNVQSIAPLESVVTKARGLALKKGEFETSAAFAERSRAAAAGIFDRSLAVLWTQPSMVKYNPDSGVAFVDRYTVNTTCSTFKFQAVEALRGVDLGADPIYDWQKRDTPYCITKDVSRAVTGSYTGSNAYGARRTVTSVKDREVGIMFGIGQIGLDVFPARDFTTVDSSPWLTAQVSVEEAKSLKANGALIFLVEPRAPYFFAGANYISPTVDAPTEISMEKAFLVAMPTCVALIDRATGKIFTSRPFEIGKFGRRE
jgi:hypothetical protein